VRWPPRRAAPVPARSCRLDRRAAAGRPTRRWSRRRVCAGSSNRGVRLPAAAQRHDVRQTETIGTDRVALSEIQRAQVSKRLAAFCDARVPSAVRDKVRLGFRVKGGEVVLFEERPAFQAPHEWREMSVAKFKYVETRRSWRLYCQHRDLRWHTYQSLPAAARFETLLDEVAADPTGIFWG